MPRPSRPLTWAIALAGGFAVARALRRRPAPPSAAAAEPHGFGTAHEPSDMNGRLMMALTAGLGLTIILVIGAMILLHGRLRAGDRAARPAYTAQQVAAVPPPAPNLQADPLQEIAAFDRAQAAQLSAYAWATPDHRTARIPIDRAKALLLGKPLDPAP